MTYYRNAFSPLEQKQQYNLATDRHDSNKWAIKNHLIKHYGYSEDDAWDIYEQFSGNHRADVDGGMTLGDILAQALKNKPKENADENNYIVSDLDGKFMLFGGEAKAFVENATMLNIPRASYRLYVEVHS